MVRSYGEVYRHVKSLLMAEEGEQAGNTARELLSFAGGCSPAALMGKLYDPISDEIERAVLLATERILNKEPLAYVIGQWSFYGLELTVTPDVLIPRDDTMAVVDLALEKSACMSTPRILDLCTGSGCIGLALASKVLDAQVVLCDISEKALAVAKENVEALGLASRVTCLLADVLEEPKDMRHKYDLIASNPPYITLEEMKDLQPSVREYEPHIALYGGVDGLKFYRAIIKNFYSALRPGGYLCFEFGQGQEEPVGCLLAEHGYNVLEFRKDSGDIVRAVIAQKKERHDEYGNG